MKPFAAANFRTFALILVAAALGVSTYARNGVWTNGVFLNRDIAKKSPSKSRVRLNLGVAYKKTGLTGKAFEEFNIGLALNPKNAEAHNSIGNIYYEMGMSAEAVREYKIAIGLLPTNAVFHNNLGLAYEKMGLMENALGEYRTTVGLNPNSYQTHLNLAVVYLEYLKDMDKARFHFAKALELNPETRNRKRIEEILGFAPAPNHGKR